jgi:hypothetical protein
MTSTPLLPTKYVPREVSIEETISWAFFPVKLPLTVMGCSQKFSEKKRSFWILFLRNKYLVFVVIPLLHAK